MVGEEFDILNRPETACGSIAIRSRDLNLNNVLGRDICEVERIVLPLLHNRVVFPPPIGERNRIVIRIRDVDLGQEPTALHVVIEINRDVGDDRSGICNCYRNRSERRSLDGTVKGDDFNSHLIAALEQLGRQCTLRLTMDDVPIDQPTIPKDHRLLIEILSFDTDADRPCKDQRTR